MYYFLYVCIKIRITMKKSILLIAFVISTGFYACAPKYTCPAYSVNDVDQEIPAEKAM